MQLDIHCQGLEIGQGLRASIEQKFEAMLESLGTQMGRVSIYLADVNGPRGGIDKRCRIMVRVPGAAQVFIEDADADLAVAVDRAIDRFERSVRGELERRRERGLRRTVKDES